MSLDSTTAITIGGVLCYDEGCEEEFDRRGARATRWLRCAWPDRAALMNAVRGAPGMVGNVYTYATNPYPDFPGLLPDAFKIKGDGVLSESVNGQAAYKWAHLTARYSTLDFGGADDQGFVGVDFGANVITLPKSTASLVWADDTTKTIPPQDTPGYTVGVATLTRMVKNLSNLPVQTILNAVENPINESVCIGAAPGTLLFEGGRAFRRIYANNAEANGVSGVWDVEYRFTCRPKIPWDFLPTDTAGVYSLKQVKFKDGSPYIGRSDLNLLLAGS